MKDENWRGLVNFWRKKLGAFDDVYDFKVWHDLSQKGKLLSFANNLGLMLHLDFVNPYGQLNIPLEFYMFQF